jgi:hypothetical protein
MIKILFCCAILLLLSCAHTPKIDSIKPDVGAPLKVERDMLVGSWYAEIPTKDGGLRKSLLQRRRDGTFTIKFLLFRNKEKVLEQVEAGFWGVSGNIYFTITREMLDKDVFKPVDTGDANYYDAYRVIDLNSKHFNYTSLDSDNEFTVKKVPDNFKLQ